MTQTILDKRVDNHRRVGLIEDEEQDMVEVYAELRDFAGFGLDSQHPAEEIVKTRI